MRNCILCTDSVCQLNEFKKLIDLELTLVALHIFPETVQLHGRQSAFCTPHFFTPSFIKVDIFPLG